MKTPRKRQDQNPQLLLRRVRGGELKTRNEWAREFGLNVHYIDAILASLRKQGYMLYSVGTAYKQGGLVKEVVKRTRDYRDVSERYAKNFTNPHVVGAFRLREGYLSEDPTRRSEVEMTAAEFVKFVEESRQKLLKHGH